MPALPASASVDTTRQRSPNTTPEQESEAVRGDAPRSGASDSDRIYSRGAIDDAYAPATAVRVHAVEYQPFRPLR